MDQHGRSLFGTRGGLLRPVGTFAVVVQSWSVDFGTGAGMASAVCCCSCCSRYSKGLGSIDSSDSGD